MLDTNTQNNPRGDYHIERDIAVLSTEVKNIRGDLDEIKELLKNAASQSVSKEDLETKLDPIRRIVYLMTGSVMLSFVSALTALIWKSVR